MRHAVYDKAISLYVLYCRLVFRVAFRVAFFKKTHGKRRGAHIKKEKGTRFGRAHFHTLQCILHIPQKFISLKKARESVLFWLFGFYTNPFIYDYFPSLC